MGKLLYSEPGYEFSNSGSGATAIKAGDVVVSGALFGIAATPIAVGGKGFVYTQGAFEVDITAGITAAVGAVAYWKAADSTIVTTDGSGANAAVGYFIKAVAATDTTVQILIG